MPDHLLRQDAADPADREAKLLELIDRSSMKGVELGVDVVAEPGTPLRDVVGADASLDFVIASHALEHAPDAIGWLREASDLLRDGGVLSLAVADHRRTADAGRRTTSTGELVDAHLRGLTAPSARQRFDQLSGGGPAADALAYQRCAVPGDDGKLDGGDVRCSVFTPDSFLRAYLDLVALGLTDLELVAFHTTAWGHDELFASLRKIGSPTLADGARAIATAESFLGQLPAGDPPALDVDVVVEIVEVVEPDPELGADPAADPAVGRPVEMSNLEGTAVLGKRLVATKARSAARRLRGDGAAPAVPAASAAPTEPDRVAPPRVPQDGTSKLRELIDLDTMLGLELGALMHPRLDPSHPNMRYLDHASTEDLKAKYADDPHAGPLRDQFVDVDYVWQPGLRLAQVVGDDAPFDFLIASHVIEHIADMIGWLDQLGEVLRDGGFLALFIPDRRWTFDMARRDTTVAELIDAHLDERQMPGFLQIYEHATQYRSDADALSLWLGIDLLANPRPDGDSRAFGLQVCRDQRRTGEYVDVHCSVFTPDSFLGLYQALVGLGLVDFEIERFDTTDWGGVDFFVVLRKVVDPTPEDRARMIEGAASYVGQPFAGGPVAEPEPIEAAGEVEPDAVGPDLVLSVSGAEARLIDGKRRALATLRRSLGRG